MSVDAATHTVRYRRAVGWVPYALVALALVPAVAGSFRLVELAGGPQLIAADPRITASPVPVVVHIVSAVVYAALGAFQFSASLRRRRPGWHRLSGRLLMALGLAVVCSGLWMTVFYARQPGTGGLAYGLRLAFASGLGACLVVGFRAVRRHDVARHRAWMTRAYALALGAGTQVFTQGLARAVFGTAALPNDLGLGAGWVLNLGIAEWVLRRAGRHSARRRVVPATASAAPR